MADLPSPLDPQPCRSRPSCDHFLHVSRTYPNKASCLSLLSNAVLVWNTVHIGRIVDQLRAAGHAVKDEDLARVSPLAHAHVIPNGSYFQSPRRRAEAAPEPVMA